MTRNAKIQFVNRFIDSVTVRPFFEDLRRIKRSSGRLEMPAADRAPAVANEAA